MTYALEFATWTPRASNHPLVKACASVSRQRLVVMKRFRPCLSFNRVEKMTSAGDETKLDQVQLDEDSWTAYSS